VLSVLFATEVFVFGVGVGVVVSRFCSAADLTESGRLATKLVCNNLIVSCQSTRVSEAITSEIGVRGLDVLEVSKR